MIKQAGRNVKLNPLSKNTEVYCCTPMHRYITCRMADDSTSTLQAHMARCKTRKTFTSTKGRTGEYSSPAKLRQGSWGNICVTRCMCDYMITPEYTVVCTHRRIHRIYSSRNYPVLGRYASSCIDFGSIMDYSNPKQSSEKFLLSPRIF